jgi:DNA-binding PadR family transcriptional regulator
MNYTDDSGRGRGHARASHGQWSPDADRGARRMRGGFDPREDGSGRGSRRRHEGDHGHHGFAFGFGPDGPGFGPGDHGNPGMPGFTMRFGPGGPGGGEFGRGPFGGRGQRGGHGPFGGRSRRRGDVRAAILALLTERPMHGYEMIQELDQRTGGVWRPSPGSVYPTLQLLEDEGLIASEATGGRKAYTLTEAGQAEAATAAANAPWAEFSAETISTGQDTREAIAGILMALKQIGFERDHDQWARAVEVLTETKRKLYAILADSE